MELRGRIQSILETQQMLQELGAKKLNDYAFEDRIYFLQGETSLEKGYVRIRSPSPEEVVAKYKIVKKVHYRGESLIAYKSYATDLERAKAKIQGHWIACLIARKGTTYQMGNGLIHLEEIEEFGPSIEAEYASEMEAREWLHQLNAAEISMHSMPLLFMIHKNKPKDSIK